MMALSSATRAGRPPARGEASATALTATAARRSSSRAIRRHGSCSWRGPRRYVQASGERSDSIMWPSRLLLMISGSRRVLLSGGRSGPLRTSSGRTRPEPPAGGRLPPNHLLLLEVHEVVDRSCPPAVLDAPDLIVVGNLQLMYADDLGAEVSGQIYEEGKLLVSLPLFCKSQTGHRQKHKRDDDFFHGILLKR